MRRDWEEGIVERNVEMRELSREKGKKGNEFRTISLRKQKQKQSAKLNATCIRVRGEFWERNIKSWLRGSNHDFSSLTQF